MAHFSCHGSLDFNLKNLVKKRCTERNIARNIIEEELDRQCAAAIRQVLWDPPPEDPVTLPLLAPDILDRGMLEQMAAGVVLHLRGGSHDAFQIVAPDGLAGLFNVCKLLNCVVLNACTKHLQGQEFLTQTSQINYVVSVRGRIRDDAALIFSRGFYRAVARHSVEDAYAFGCSALRAKFSPEVREIATEDNGGVPHLHMRPMAEAPLTEARFRFLLIARVPREDVVTKGRKAFETCNR